MLKWHRYIRAELLRNFRNLRFEFFIEPARGHAQSAVENRTGRIRDDARRIEIEFRSEAIADFACTIDAVERKRSRLDGGNTHSAIDAGHLFGIETLFAVHNRNQHDTFGELDGLFDGGFETFFDVLLDHQAVDNDLDRVILLPVEFDRLIEIVEHTINAAAHVSGLRQGLELLFELAFAAPHDGREDHHALAILQCLHVTDDLIRSLFGDRLFTLITVRDSNRGEEQPQIVVDFRDGAYSRTRAARRSFLFDGNGRGKSFDGIHIRRLQPIQKLPRICRKRLHVSPLAFGIDRVKGQARFSGTAKTCYNSEFIAGNFNADVLEIVLPGAANSNAFDDTVHRLPICRQ